MSDPSAADRHSSHRAARPVLDDDLRQELRATLLAARELGPEFEPVAVDSFLDQLMPAIEQRRQSASRSGRSQRPKRGLVLAGFAVVVFALTGHASHMHGAFGTSFSTRHGTVHRLRAPHPGAIPPAVPPSPAAPPAPPS